MHIKHVRTNLKVGADTAIGPKTLLVGPNGSGKSTVINAVELALTGRVSDIAGREDVAREADVMALAPAGQSLLAEVTFNDDTGASYAVEGSTAKAKKAVAVRPRSIDPDAVLPIRTLKEALLGSPVTARKFLLGKVAGAVTRTDIAALLPEAVHPLWFTALASVPSALSAPDALVAVLEMAGKQQREATASAKTQREAARLVGGGRAAPPTAAQVAEAAKTVQEARETYQRALAAESAFDRIAGTRTRLGDAIVAAQQAVEAHALAQSDLANLPEVAPVHPVLSHVCEVLRVSVEKNECLICGQGKPSASDLTAVEAAIAASKAANAQRLAAEGRVNGLRAAAERAISVVQTLEREVESLGEASDPLGWTAADAKRDLDKLEAQYLDYKATADAWTKVQGAESAALEAEAASQRWSALKGACEEAVAVVLDRALAAFVAKVQSHLPKGDTFDLRLKDGEREVVQFGLVREGRIHTALSGAEWARVMAAMASATAGDGFAVLIPEERAFDPQTLTAVLRAFADVPQQVILASPVAPAGRLPKGWTVVQTTSRTAPEDAATDAV
jgi:hypothetical protein